MGTVVEKIFSQHLNRPVHAGEMVVVDVDASMMQDINGPAVIENFDSIAGYVSSPGRHLAVLDHCSPCPSVNAANTQKKMREFAWRQGMRLADQGEGVCHQVMLESGMVRPGSIAVGTDSHSCMYGALNAFGAAVSAADEAVILACGRAWFRVPETIRVEFTGRPAPGISAMDLALYMAATLGVSGAQYRCLEFGGEALRFLSVDARATICNIAAETGAKCAIMPYDEILKKWLSEQKRGDTRGSWRTLTRCTPARWKSIPQPACRLSPRRPASTALCRSAAWKVTRFSRFLSGPVPMAVWRISRKPGRFCGGDR